MSAEMAIYNAIPDTPGSGAYPATKEEDPRLPDHVIYRPRDLASVGKGKLGVVGWGNGGCAADGASARLHLAEIASHGYVVVAPGTIASGPGVPPPAPQMPAASGRFAAATNSQQVMAGVAWVIAEGKRRGSPYYGRIDPKMVAVSGHSCGGLQALELAPDPRVKAVVIHNSGVFRAGFPGMDNMSVSKATLGKLRTPVVYINGGPSDIAYENGMDDYRLIDRVPVAMLNNGAGHGGTFHEPDGGINAQVAVAWLDWQLRGDKNAAKMFVGEECGLCTDGKWVVQRKQFPTTVR